MQSECKIRSLVQVEFVEKMTAKEIELASNANLYFVKFQGETPFYFLNT